jgi:acetylornithine aminotransferase/acetylornithine/N-succinyldiaminopimelate aminotransferase
MPDWKALEKQYYMPTFNRLPVVLVKGEGCRVWDDQGRVYLDLVAGIAVNVLGHGHPAVVGAICEQAQNLVHVSNLYYTTPQLELAKLIVDNSCGSKIFYANSGAEANEGAFKVARKFGRLNRNGAYEVISMANSFHGRTLATLAATGQTKFHTPFAPMPDGFKFVDFNDINAVKQATSDKTAAIIVEVVQGESGVHPADKAYLQQLRAFCDEANLLLIIDEIQTGMGRTGHFLGYQGFGVEPDVFTMAKGLAGGVPIGAIIVNDRANVLTAGDHGSTFGGNPLACAAGVATVSTIFEQGLIQNAKVMGQRFEAGLKDLQAKNPVITEIRTAGLMVAFDLSLDKAAQVANGGLDKGLILNYTGPNTVRMVPPLIITAAEVDEVVSKIGELVAAI